MSSRPAWSKRVPGQARLHRETKTNKQMNNDVRTAAMAVRFAKVVSSFDFSPEFQACNASLTLYVCIMFMVPAY